MVESRAYGQGNHFCMELANDGSSALKDAELLAAASSWMKLNPNAVLLGLSLNRGNNDEINKLTLFIEVA